MEGIEKLAVREWSQGLAGMTASDIQRGLMGWQGEWPPTLPEFAAACRGKKIGKNDFGLDYVPECYRAPPINDRSRLLSSGDRDVRRRAAGSFVFAMRSALKSEVAEDENGNEDGNMRGV